MTAFRLAAVYVAAFVVVIGFAGPTRADDPPYRLGDGDLIRLNAPTTEGLSGAYRLGENGEIALPVDETVTLGGLTLQEARMGVKAALSRTFKQLSVGVELVERRPFFISGAVAQPGGYPHLSGLTLGEAVALAGGPYRVGGSDALQTTITSVRSDEEYLGARHDLAVAGIKAARIAAMLAGQKTITAPDKLGGVEEIEFNDLLFREAAIMYALNEARTNRVRLVSERLVAKTAEVGTLEESIALVENRLAKVTGDLAIAETEVANGLITRERLESLDRIEDQIRSEMLQTIVLLNQARGDRLDLVLKVDELPRQWQVDLLHEAADTQQRMAQLERSLDASAQMLNATEGAHEPGVSTVFAITRDGQQIIGIADATTAVLPGDLVEVTRQTDLNGPIQ